MPERDGKILAARRRLAKAIEARMTQWVRPIARGDIHVGRPATPPGRIRVKTRRPGRPPHE